jgi:hypothetical protein
MGMARDKVNILVSGHLCSLLDYISRDRDTSGANAYYLPLNDLCNSPSVVRSRDRGRQLPPRLQYTHITILPDRRATSLQPWISIA